MKSLLSTTAVVVALGLPALSFAQTSDATTATDTQVSEFPGFLAARGQSDVFASELMGHDVYARRTPAETAVEDGSQDMTMMSAGELDEMDNIGQINEIVLSSDGQVRALVIGVGGFLGVGEQDVAVTMDQVTFASDPDNRDEMYVVVNTGADMLKTSPPYERAAMNSDGMDATAGDTTAQTAADTTTETAMDGTQSDRTPFVAPTIERDGYNAVAVTEVTSEMLVGKEVYGVEDNSVGTIDDLILDDSGAITNVIIDFGGFLGMGTSQVSVGYDELTILADEGRSDVRVYVDATKEQVQAQPQYRATN
jgi:sporulation protein YlmC with PRC-barrel domain